MKYGLQLLIQVMAPMKELMEYVLILTIIMFTLQDELRIVIMIILL